MIQISMLGSKEEVLLTSFYKAGIILMTNLTGRSHGSRCKTLKQLLSSQIQQCIKWVHDQVGFVSECKICLTLK